MHIMKLMIMTDIEGVAGILNFEDWCVPEGRYYDKGKRLLTEEVNAAIDGFYEGGAGEVTVVDGHGSGAIDPELLDERVWLSQTECLPSFPEKIACHDPCRRARECTTAENGSVVVPVPVAHPAV